MQETISILKTSKSLHHYVLTNDVNGASQCLSDDVMAWSTRDTNGLTSLMIAATLNRLEVINVLLTSKCDVNEVDVKGNTALHLAVDEGHLEVVKKLVNSGRCVVDALNCAGESALMRAAFYDYVEAARSLLKEGGADPEVRNTEGQTALLVALQEGSHMTADVLVKTGCDVTVTDNMGRTALYMAIHSPCIKTLECAKLLVENEAMMRKQMDMAEEWCTIKMNYFIYEQV
ncbi:SECG-like protein [Mya arenaria]|uniref:SECG-like protein n=1 Tax=Mya arenaria TaxID=6604 RepID=A0ABY7EMW9_MYAAR|nr:SECG-like protein [Mya arenaria]